MSETVSIDWVLMLSHFLWILGVAVFVALAALKRFPKVGLWLGGGLFVGGLLLTFSVLPPGRLIAVKVENLEAASQLPAMDGERSLPPSQLKLDPINRVHPINNKKMKDNTLVLFWDGFIKSPYYRFAAGRYRFRFKARGTKVKGVFSKIKIEFESPESRGYLISRAHKYIQLSGKMQDYDLTFRVSNDTIGRVRITFYNDLHLEGTYKGRDVFVKDWFIGPIGPTGPIRRLSR